MTHKAHHLGEREGFANETTRPVVLTTQDKLHIALDIDPHGAGLATRRKLQAQIVEDAGVHTFAAENALVLVDTDIIRESFQVTGHQFSPPFAILITSL